jgi:hypothetical protein
MELPPETPSFLVLTYKTMDAVVIEISCKYYFIPMSREDLYDELKRNYRSKDDVNHVLILVACMQDPHKECFPSYQHHCDALRSALKEVKI